MSKMLSEEEVKALNIGLGARVREMAGKMPLAYVSGPYRHPKGTAFVERNIRAAEGVAQDLWQLGFAVICPHTNTKHFDGLAEPEVWLAGDLVMVEKCDVLVMIPGWQYSQGAYLEWEHHVKRGGAVFYWPDDRPKLIEFVLSYRPGRRAA